MTEPHQHSHRRADPPQRGIPADDVVVEEEADATLAELRDAFFERPAWEERYGAREATWTGRVNAQLAAEAADLEPGRALDVGSGEGADAIWLAARGWEVTGLEFSSVARERAAAHAAEAGLAARISWRDADLREWRAGAERWDLVTAHYFHQPDGGMVDVVRRLGDAVAPGGILLIVGHHPADLDTGLRHGPRAWLYAAEDLLPALDPDRWEVAVVEARPREMTVPGSAETMPVTDAVLRARRR